MSFIYRGQRINILQVRHRDLDSDTEFSRRELWEYLMGARGQPDIYDDLEARAFNMYVAWFSHLSAKPLNSDLWPYNRKKFFGGGKQAGQANQGQKSGGVIQKIKNVFTRTPRYQPEPGIPADVSRLSPSNPHPYSGNPIIFNSFEHHSDSGSSSHAGGPPRRKTYWKDSKKLH